jgi:hypothetical protein
VMPITAMSPSRCNQVCSSEKRKDIVKLVETWPLIHSRAKPGGKWRKF